MPKVIHLNTKPLINMIENELSGSLTMECERRLTNLFKESHKWLLQVAFKNTKNTENSECLVQELYEYLHLKQNPRLFWGENSYNLLYCSKFIKHRFINKTKKLNRTTYVEEVWDTEFDVPYDEDKDLQIQQAHQEVLNEVKRLKSTKMFASAMIWELYWCSDDTLDEVANKIKISKSTTFLAVKKVRKYLEQVIDNPFDKK
jgi:DNA-directed RNA polymerase specialized sigma24 family protein